jgi:SagB-type dehydrogenase family enzyme
VTAAGRLPAEPTIQFEELVRHGDVALDDAAEGYHEASRLYPSTAAAAVPGLALIESDPVVHASMARSSRRHPHRPGIDLPPPRRPRARLGRALDRRRSSAPLRRTPLRLAHVSTLLDCAYGVRTTAAGTRRTVPSGGALYPLELYALVAAVDGVPVGLHHYDPFAHRLELLRDRAAPAELAAALVDPALVERAALLLVVTAVLWRTRFKYGARGYRFALLEAGHVTQNVVLACAALGLPALPVGGFYDRGVDAVVGANGLDEASLYVVAIGGRGSR